LGYNGIDLIMITLWKGVLEIKFIGTYTLRSNTTNFITLELTRIAFKSLKWLPFKVSIGLYKLYYTKTHSQLIL
jgi:hypothetical protein